jgi:hypothetical protein
MAIRSSNQFCTFTLGIIVCSASIAACSRDYKRPQLSDPPNASSSAVGALGNDKAETKSDAAKADERIIQSKTILPKDANGEVGSTTASNIRPGNLNSAASSQIDVSRYPFKEKEEFKTFMRTRIQAVDQGLKIMQDQPSQVHVPPQNIKDLENKENEIASRINKVDSVDEAHWDQFKSTFRDDVVGLERSYQMLSTAKR